MRAGLRRKALCLLFGLFGLVFGIVGAENTFGRLRDASGAALLFSLEVRDEAGALLASPMLVGGRLAFISDQPFREACEVDKQRSRYALPLAGLFPLIPSTF